MKKIWIKFGTFVLTFAVIMSSMVFSFPTSADNTDRIVEKNLMWNFEDATSGDASSLIKLLLNKGDTAPRVEIVEENGNKFLRVYGNGKDYAFTFSEIYNYISNEDFVGIGGFKADTRLSDMFSDRGFGPLFRCDFDSEGNTTKLVYSTVEGQNSNNSDNLKTIQSIYNNGERISVSGSQFQKLGFIAKDKKTNYQSLIDENIFDFKDWFSYDIVGGKGVYNFADSSFTQEKTKVNMKLNTVISERATATVYKSGDINGNNFDAAESMISGFGARSVASTSYVDIDNVSVTLLIDYSNNAELTAFLAEHNGVLSLTTANVSETDETAVNAAISAYEAISDNDVKTALASEKALLDSLLDKINVIKSEQTLIEEAKARLLAEFNGSGMIKNNLTDLYEAKAIFASPSTTGEIAVSNAGLYLANGKYVTNSDYSVSEKAPVSIEGTFKVEDIDSNWNIYLLLPSGSGIRFYKNANLVQSGWQGFRLNTSGGGGNWNNDAENAGFNLDFAKGISFRYTFISNDTYGYGWKFEAKTIDAENYTFAFQGNAKDYHTDNCNYIAINSIGNMSLSEIKIDYGVEEVVEAFKTTHATALALTTETVSKSDAGIVNAAIDAYNAIAYENVKSALSNEIALLNSLKAKIDELLANESAIAAKKAELYEQFKISGKVSPSLSDIIETSAVLTSNSGNFVVNEAGLKLPSGSSFYNDKQFSIDGMPPLSIEGTISLPETNYEVKFAISDKNNITNADAADNDGCGISIRQDGKGGRFNGGNLISQAGPITVPATVSNSGDVDFKFTFVKNAGGKFMWTFSLKNSGDSDYTEVMGTSDKYMVTDVSTLGIIMASGEAVLKNITVDYGTVFPTENGTSILNISSMENQNIRFAATIPAGRSDMKLVKYGQVFMLDYYLDGAELTLDTVSKVNGKIKAVSESVAENKDGYSGSIDAYYVEIGNTSLAKYRAIPICARSFCVYNDAAGNSYTVYSQNNASKQIGEENVVLAENGVTTSSVVRAAKNIGKFIMTKDASSIDFTAANADEITAILTKTSNTADEEISKLLSFIVKNSSLLGL